MKFYKYLKDKLYLIGLFFISYIFILFLFFAFKVRIEVTIVVSIILFLLLVLCILIDYYKKKSFYSELLSNIEKLDKAYLVLETLYKPEFYEGELLYQALYDINKSMNENIKSIYDSLVSFKEYIEMWIHEVKRPISTLTLIGNKNKFDYKTKAQLKRLEDYVDQVLYYVRSETAGNDYLIKEVSLSEVVKNVAVKNMDDLLNGDIDFIVNDADIKVLTDSKWLEFILGQIINNSIKYRRDDVKSFISISVEDLKNRSIICIEDNGIGIPKSDISRVFDKSFTGYNGRIKSKSTGMGLHIAKNLCLNLGHNIEIESKKNKYTKVYITIFKNDYFDVVK